MNRRTFLKSIATVCGAVVVCPGELVKPDPGGKLIHRVVTLGSSYTPKIPWKHYYITYHYSQKQLITELEKEFWNTKFKSPLIIGAHDEKIQTLQRPNPLRSQACDPSG